MNTYLQAQPAAKGALAMLSARSLSLQEWYLVLES